MDPSKLNTYSIGLKGSVDLMWARRAANYLGTRHHEVCLSEQEFLNAIKDTVYQIESYDTTSVRASLPNFLISKYISQNSDDVVIFCDNQPIIFNFLEIVDIYINFFEIFDGQLLNQITKG
jgi:asparagine synthetase B (glutamine-hydrolysing)